MQKHNVSVLQKLSIYLVVYLFLFFFLQLTAYGEIVVFKGEQGNGTEIPNTGHYSFNKIAAYNRCNTAIFTVVNNGEQAVDFVGEKITLLDASGSGGLAFALNIDELTDTILPGGNTKFTLQFISKATDGTLKKALVTLSFAGGEQPYEFYVSCNAKEKMICEFTEFGIFYWQSPGYGTMAITLVGAGGGGGGGAGCTSEGEGQGGAGGKAGQIVLDQYSTYGNNLYTIFIGYGGAGGIEGLGCNERSGGTGSAGNPSIIYHENSVIFTANGGSGGIGGDGPGEREGEYGQSGYNGAPGGSPGSTSGQNGEDGGAGSTGAGGGGGQAGRPSEGGYCYPHGGEGGPGGWGYCKIEWTGFLG